MKRTFLFNILIFSIYLVSSQNVYFGYPQNEVSFRKGDIIVVNIPSFYLTGYYFVQDSQLDNLSLFTNKYDSLSFRIEINFCLGRCFDTSYCMEVSNILKEHLLVELQRRNPNQNNFTIISRGLYNPIYKNNENMIKSREECIKYERYNTRLEIVVE